MDPAGVNMAQTELTRDAKAELSPRVLLTEHRFQDTTVTRQIKRQRNGALVFPRRDANFISIIFRSIILWKNE